MNYLLADIGGTNSRLVLTNSNFKILKRSHFKTINYNSLEDLFSKFLENKPIDIVAISIAGPIKKNLRLTNNKIKINKQSLLKIFKLKKIYFLNDFEANSYSLINIINNKKKHLIIGPGTGLGVPYIENNKVKSSEDGHILFESSFIQLNNFVKRKLGKKKLEAEYLISGKGLELIYEFYSNGKTLSAREVSKSKLFNSNSKKAIEIFKCIFVEFVDYLTLKKNYR